MKCVLLGFLLSSCSLSMCFIQPFPRLSDPGTINKRCCFIHLHMNSALYQTLDDQVITEFEGSMKSKGANFPKLRHAYFNPTERRGLVAIEEIRQQETIITIPKNLAICLSPRERCPEPALRTFWDAHSVWYVRLGMKLLLERDKGPASPTASYIAFLPADLPPCFPSCFLFFSLSL